MFYNLYYISRSRGICGSDFKRDEFIETINLNHVSSVSQLSKFYTPFSEEYCGEYATVSMVNGDIFHIKKSSYEEFIKLTEKFMVG